MKSLYFLFFCLLLLTSCQKALKDPLDSFSGGPQLGIPTLTEFSYWSAGSEVHITPPYLTTIDIIADSGSAPCGSNESKVSIKGTYDTEQVNDIETNGLLKTTLDVENGLFTATGCLPRGASSLKLKGLTADGKKSNSVSLSVNVSSGISTLAWGHPQYPSPGFKANSASHSSALSSQGIELSNVNIESNKAQAIQSTGNSSYSLQMGFVQTVKESL